jgi:hypothetical protein
MLQLAFSCHWLSAKVLIHTFLEARSLESSTAQIVLARPGGSPLQILLEVKDIRQMEWGP